MVTSVLGCGIRMKTPGVDPRTEPHLRRETHPSRKTLDLFHLVLMEWFWDDQSRLQPAQIVFGRVAPATDVPCEAHVEALLAQVPGNRARTCPFKHGLVKNPEFTQAIEPRQNAERLLSDTKVKAIRIAKDLKRLNRYWPVSVPRGLQLPTAGIGHHVLTSPSSWNQMLLESPQALHGVIPEVSRLQRAEMSNYFLAATSR